WRGSLKVRDTVVISRPHDDREIQPARVTSLAAFVDGREHQAQCAVAGEMARLGGLADARIGDWLGTPLRERIPAFEPPVFEVQVMPIDPNRRFDLLQALSTLSDEDPLIGVRIDEVDHATFIHLYGEVQREVIESMLRERFGLAVAF